MIVEEFLVKIQNHLENYQEDWYCKSLSDSENYSTDTQMNLGKWLEDFVNYMENIL